MPIVLEILLLSHDIWDTLGKFEVCGKFEIVTLVFLLSSIDVVLELR